MARKITAPFTLTENVAYSAAGTFGQDTIDIASYISVGSRQALQIHKVDFVYQSTDSNDIVHVISRGMDTALAAGADGECLLQLTDLNRGAMVVADDAALIASGQLRITPSGDFHASDLYPDNYKGPEGRTVVNDQLYFSAYADITGGFDAGAVLQFTVRIECQIVELTTQDWMAIAIQSTAADN